MRPHKRNAILQTLMCSIQNVIFVASILSAIVLAACTQASSAPPPNATVVSGAPPPTRTLSRDQVLLQSALAGTPIPEWQGIPVMPGVIKASVMGSGYSYLVNEPLNAVENFYQQKLSEAGWKLTQRETADTSKFGGPSVALDFEKNPVHANIIVLVSTRDQATVVVINVIK